MNFLHLLPFLLAPVAAQETPSCTPLAHAPYTVHPYEIPKHVGYTPSGRPSTTPPIASWNFTFYDPNTCTTGSCNITWNIQSDLPTLHGGFVPCTETDIPGGMEAWKVDFSILRVRWTFPGVEETGEERDFTMVGNGTWEYKQVCGGSGVCSTWTEKTNYLDNIWEDGEGDGDEGEE